MDVLKLRKLALKSRINNGKYSGWTVQDLIAMSQNGELLYMYLCYDRIDFLPEVREAMFMPDELIVNKPGKVKYKSDEFFRLKDLYWENYYAQAPEAIKAMGRKIHARKQKAAYTTLAKKDQLMNNKARMAQRNGRK